MVLTDSLSGNFKGSSRLRSRGLTCSVDDFVVSDAALWENNARCNLPMRHTNKHRQLVRLSQPPSVP